MRRDEIRQGRERVERLLLAPLEERGLRKQKRQSAEQLAAMKGRIAARLAYMSAEALVTLRLAVEHGARGEARNLWPDEISVMNWAHTIEPPPETHSPLVVSYMKSAAGRAAWGRCAFEAAALLRYLKRYGAPRDVSWISIREDAEEMRRVLARARERGDAAVVAEWEARKAEVLALVEGRVEADEEMLA